MNVQEFTPRNYQTELMKVALMQNTIIFLPTGSGKTYIALMVLKQMGGALLKSYGEGGKITIILVNTVALVDQHALYIHNHTDFNVGKYSGEMNLDFWPREKWYDEYNKHQVFVMTSQILVNLVNSSHIDLNKVNLIIFDECHRGVNDHSMRQLMKSFECLREPPRVIGLTATLLNGNCKPARVIKEVENLETTYHSKVATVDELKAVVGFSTNPNETVVTFEEYIIRPHEQYAINILNRMIEMLEAIKVEPIAVPIGLKGLKPLDTAQTESKLRNIIKDLIYHIETMGSYCGHKASLSHTIQIERIKKHCDDLNILTVLTGIQTTLTFVTEILKHADTLNEGDKILKYSSHQILTLLKIFKEYEQLSKEDLCCIIFTKRRFTAKIIYHMLHSMSQNHSDYNHIKVNFMVGHNNNPYNDTRESLYIHKQNKQVLDSFVNKEINVLVASNVLEEGVDIPKCTLVIKYDYPEDYRSYIQSKGRARHRESLFYMMVSERNLAKLTTKYKEFQLVERTLNNFLIGNNENRPEPSQADIEAMYNEDEIPPYYVDGLNSAQVNLRSAIPLLCQYCASLPSDMYTVHAPDWFVEYRDGECRVVILLPLVCKILDLIKGPFMKTIKQAKRAAALTACIQLHKAGALDDHLLPVKMVVKEEDVIFLFTHYPKKKELFDGSLKSRRLHQKLIPKVLKMKIKHCSTVYVHFIKLDPMFRRQSDDISMSTVYDMYTSPLSYGIVTSSPLPEICDFPIYVLSGTINVSLKVNQLVLSVTDKDIENIKNFHVKIFEDVLKILQRFLAFDTGDNPEMMLLVPVNNTNNTIDWNVLQANIPVNNVQELSIDDKNSLEVTPEAYLRKIVGPWYRRDPSTYIVSEVCLNLSANSAFPNEEYGTFVDYFKERHGLKLRNPSLPLLLVKRLTKNKNFTKPRSRIAAKRKHDKINSELTEYLPPELVVKQEFPASLWIQANFLPTILSRISFLLQLEELRTRIVREKGLGQKILKVQNPLKLDEYLLAYEPQIEEGSNVELPLNLPPTAHQSSIRINKDFTNKILESQYPWKNIEEPPDIERSLTVSIMDIEHYEAFVGSRISSARDLKNSYSPKKQRQLALTYPKNFTPVNIKLLDPPVNENGPDLSDLFRALTSAKANEIVNLERYETLGDSFLKLIISVYIYLRFPQYDQGRLTELKGRLVSNRNLYYLAVKKDLDKIIKFNELSPEDQWLPPGFAIPKEMLQRINNKELSLSALFGLSIPLEEQISGNLSNDTKQDIFSDECPPTDTEESNYQTMANFLKCQYIGDKHVADVVESLLGTYFNECGVRGGLKLMEWLGLIPESENLEMLLQTTPPSPLLSPELGETKINFHLPLREKIENIIGYKFRNRAYLLQALTHSSYTPNRTTLSYEKLEFLGDAVLDFLITCYIFESCDNLNPGELTDLRSALVNNNTFASLFVRLGLHKYLLMMNDTLQRLIDKFVTFMEQKNYVIDEEVMILLQEDEYQLAESVDVPKILGDVFEAIAGAIYLDSNQNLETVWNVFYKIMWKEIDLFSHNVPKNVVRKLFEWNGAHPQFGKPTLTSNNKSMISLQFLQGGIPSVVHGFGTNKTMARKAAAKLALSILDRRDR